jgi:acetyltransferase
MALVAERLNQNTGAHELLGVARLIRQRDLREAELGLVVADRWQGAGLGTELLGRLIKIARCEGIDRIRAEILSENVSMIKLAKHFHFRCVRGDDPQSLIATLNLIPHRPRHDVQNL